MKHPTAVITAPGTNPPTTLRPAGDADGAALAVLWHDGWLDGHLGHVPEALYEHRRPPDFLARILARLGATTVAVDGSAIVGFVTVVDDEVEQLYVTAAVRGGGVATDLLDHAERLVSMRSGTAWLAVVPGNVRARRFYARRGWRDAGLFDHLADIPGGSMVVPSHRYEQSVGVR